MEQEEQRWQLVNHRVLVKDAWLEVYENSYELPDGSRLDDYHALRERDGVVIVALTPAQEVLMVRQYRPGIAAFTYEMPAGYLEDGESDALQRAQAELREETGYLADDWHSLGILHDLPSRMQKTTHVFVAGNATKATATEQDQTEFVAYERIPLQQAQAMIRDNRITSAVMVAALYKAFLHAQMDIFAASPA